VQLPKFLPPAQGSEIIRRPSFMRAVCYYNDLSTPIWIKYRWYQWFNLACDPFGDVPAVWLAGWLLTAYSLSAAGVCW